MHGVHALIFYHRSLYSLTKAGKSHDNVPLICRSAEALRNDIISAIVYIFFLSWYRFSVGMTKIGLIRQN